MKILPLAATMMLGPQILFAILLITKSKPVKLSLVYVSAVGFATTVGVIVMTLLASAVGSLNLTANSSQAGKYIETGLVILLIIGAIKSFRERKNPKEPKWLAKLQSINIKSVFKLGCLMIFLMPSDLVVMFTVGVHIFSHNISAGFVAAFIALTILIASIPMISFIIFRKRAEVFMPKARDWMVDNNAVVNIAIYIFFIILILS